MTVKNILCYGDSITWGYNPETVSRYTFEQRWTGVLQNTLGNEYRIIEEGLNGRTTAFDDPFMADRNGSKTLPLILESHAPLDAVILLLGTGDLKDYISGKARYAAIGISQLIRLIMCSQTDLGAKPAKILLLSPPLIIEPTNFMATIFADSESESKKFAKEYHNIAQFFNINFIDTSTFLNPSKIDGVHLDVHNNQLLGERVATEIKNMFENHHI